MFGDIGRAAGLIDTLLQVGDRVVASGLADGMAPAEIEALKIGATLRDSRPKVRTIRRSEASPANRAEGVKLNNMTPSKTNAGVTVLQQGLDTLLFSIYGTLRPEYLDLLNAGKLAAQQSETGDWSLSPLPAFDGTALLVHASGVKYYDWVSRSQDLTVTIRKPGKSPMPAAIVRVAAETLWRMGGGGMVAAALAEHCLRPIFEDDGVYRVVVKAAHLATDFQGWRPEITDLAYNGPIVKRADGLDPHLGERNELETIAAGRSKEIRVSLYNKGRQAKKTGRSWVFDLWAATGRYDPTQDTWRNEFQFGRAFLHDRGIETLDQLRDQMAGLWEYGMGWFSFRTPNPADATHPYRWPVAPHWAALTPWALAEAVELPRVKVVRPKYRRLAAGLAGYLTSTMAITGTQNPYEAIRVVMDAKGREDFDKLLQAKQERYAGFTMDAA